MDTPVVSQTLTFQAYDNASAATIFITMNGYDSASGTFIVKFGVSSQSGVSRIRNFILPADGLEHDVEIRTHGLSCDLYVDGAYVGNVVIAAGSPMDRVDFVTVDMQPINLVTTMSISQVEINNCPMPAKALVWHAAGDAVVSMYVLPLIKGAVSVAWGVGRFVVVGLDIAANNGKSEYSTDLGVTWQSGGTLVFGSNQAPRSLAYGAGLFVAMQQNVDTLFYTSPDGVTWTTRTKPSGDVGSLTFVSGKFFIGPASPAAFIYSSTDGITFNSVAMPATARWGPIAGENSALVAVRNESTGACAYSSNGGVTWTSGGTVTTSKGLIVGNGVFVSLSDNTGLSSLKTQVSFTGGVTWSAQSADIVASPTYAGIVFDLRVFYLTINGAAVYSSVDGLTWSALPNTIPHATPNAMATNGLGHFVALSSNAGGTRTRAYGLFEDI